MSRTKRNSSALLTITVQIGNSDDKLTQREWFEFHQRVRQYIRRDCAKVHFDGAPIATAPWQNAAFVFEASAAQAMEIRMVLKSVRKSYRQDSIAWTEGATAFV